MGRRKPTLGYPSRTDAVVALRRQGLTQQVVADRIGIAVATVAALEYSRRLDMAGPREDMRQVFFEKDVIARIEPHATARGLMVNELIRQIINTVLDEKLVDAVLDDQAEAQ